MMEQEQYRALFNSMHPGFFERDYIRPIPPQNVYEEMILPLESFDAAAFHLPVPEGTSFGFYNGELEPLLAEIGRVSANWPQYFNAERRIYCGYFQGKIASFCLMEDMGVHRLGDRQVKVGGPGCVGTLPEFRRRGIGLKMVCDVTELLQKEGYDLSYIHYTGVAPWYAKLGYRTVLRWNSRGLL